MDSKAQGIGLAPPRPQVYRHSKRRMHGAEYGEGDTLDHPEGDLRRAPTVLGKWFSLKQEGSQNWGPRTSRRDVSPLLGTILGMPAGG